MSDQQQAWRKAIADQVRRNCTPSSEAYAKGGDALIYAVADWIENPPAWSQFTEPGADAGIVTVKLVLDTTDFDAAVERAKAALAELVATPIKVEVQ